MVLPPSKTGIAISLRGVRYLGGDFNSLVGNIVIERIDETGEAVTPSKGLILLRNKSKTPRFFTIVHELGHILTYQQPKSMEFFMTELGSTCVNGNMQGGVEYCSATVGSYNPGQYAGTLWPYGDPLPKDTRLPSDYASTGNWEDYAETFALVLSEAYIRSKDLEYRKEAKFVYDWYINHDIGRRRKIMKLIINGNWR